MERSARAEAKVDTSLEAQALIGSFLQAQKSDRDLDERLDAMEAELGLPPLRMPARSPHLPPFGAGTDLPITVGRRL